MEVTIYDFLDFTCDKCAGPTINAAPMRLARKSVIESSSGHDDLVRLTEAAAVAAAAYCDFSSKLCSLTLPATTSHVSVLSSL